jgi:hypothetical protein
LERLITLQKFFGPFLDSNLQMSIEDGILVLDFGKECNKFLIQLIIDFFVLMVVFGWHVVDLLVKIYLFA